MLQNSTNLGRARRVVAEVNRGTYDQNALAKALHGGAHVATQVATNQLPAIILELLSDADNVLTVQEIAELLEVEETRVSQAIRKLLEQCKIDRIYREGVARYSSWGTQPRADNLNQTVLNSLRRYPRGLSIPKLCEYIGVHIPANLPSKFREFVNAGILEEVEDKQNRRKVYRIRK
jgi:predicted XRE-type DNA-binding protein